MIPAEVIRRKRDGQALTADELGDFMSAFVAGSVPDYQMSAFLMAVLFNGLDPVETDTLVRSMLDSGQTLDLSYLAGPRIDKHSTGGVGDKASLVLAPLVAALDVYVPMMSGRGLGHTTGTLDKLEAIPSFRTNLSLEEFRRVLQNVGFAMIGQTAEIAPLDRRLYALRDVTATVPSIPLIAASIMSKKLAEGLTGLVLDVKVGSGAFVPEEERALELARTMVAIGDERGLPTRALLTAMDRPLGVAVGNGLETREAIECLGGGGPPDLRELVLAQAVEMLVLATPDADRTSERVRAEAALDSGVALERFARVVEAQGGDPRVIDDPERLPSAPERFDVRSHRAGVVTSVSPRPLGEAVVRLGGGRLRMEDEIDARVGFEVTARPGQTVGHGDLIGIVHARTPDEALAGAAVLQGCVQIGAAGSDVIMRPLVSHRVGPEGTEPYPV